MQSFVHADLSGKVKSYVKSQITNRPIWGLMNRRQHTSDKKDAEECEESLITACAAVAVLTLFAGSASANHGYYGQSFNQSHASSGYGFVQPQPHAHWHNTSHYDYHPAQIVPHGNHFHVQPGHYDRHQTGHFDYHW